MTGKPSLGTNLAFAVGAFACCVAAALFAPAGFAHRDGEPSAVSPAGVHALDGGRWVTVRGHVDPSSLYVHLNLLDPDAIGLRLFETGPGLVIVTNIHRTRELDDKVGGYGADSEPATELGGWLADEHTFTGMVVTPTGDVDDSGQVELGNSHFDVTGYSSFCEARSCPAGAPRVLLVGDEPDSRLPKLLATIVLGAGAFVLGFFAVRRRWLLALVLVPVVPGLVLATVYVRGGLRGEPHVVASPQPKHAPVVFRERADPGCTTPDDCRARCDAREPAACRRLGELDENASPLELFHRACGDGDLAACVDESNIYVAGFGIESDNERGMKILTKACFDGDRDACIALAAASLDGKEIERDPFVVLAYAEPTCTYGAVAACAIAGNAQDTLGKPELAIEHERMACEARFPTACAALARHYKWGWGVAADPAKAEQLEKLARVEAKD